MGILLVAGATYDAGVGTKFYKAAGSGYHANCCLSQTSRQGWDNSGRRFYHREASVEVLRQEDGQDLTARGGTSRGHEGK
jgi:hypothetical protein